MTNKLLAAAAAVAVLSVSTLRADDATLKAYAQKAMQKCPDAKFTVEQIRQPGPAGFLIYGVTETSSDSNCGRQSYMLYSPLTQQIFLGAVFVLPGDQRPVDIRASEEASRVLKEPITATVSGFPLPDGVKNVALTKQTKYGPFSYHGFVDASERFLIVGSRGNLRTPPSQSLLENLGLQNAVRRGNRKAKVQIVELSDFQCPTCGRAHKKIEPILSKHLDRVDYYRLDLPLFEHHEWAIFAALGARAIQKVSPSKYWSYVNFIFANQETIDKSQFDTVLKNFCDDNDINWKSIEKIYHSPQEKTSLLEQVSRAFDNGIVSTPTYIIDGQMIGYGPEGAYTIEQVKKAVGVR